MRLLLLVIFLSAAAAADQVGADAARMTPEAYAQMLERGEAERRDELATVRSARPSPARTERLTHLAAAKGSVLPLVAYEIGSAGVLPRTFTVDRIVGPSTTIIRDLNDIERRLLVDGYDNTKLVDHDGFTPDGVVFEVDGRRTIAGATLLHLQAKLPPAK